MKKSAIIIIFLFTSLTVLLLFSGKTENTDWAFLSGTIAVGDKPLQEGTAVYIYAKEFNLILRPDDQGHYEARLPLGETGCRKFTVFAQITYTSCYQKFITEKKKLTLFPGELNEVNFIYPTAVVCCSLSAREGEIVVKNMTFDDFFQCREKISGSRMVEITIPAERPLMVGWQAASEKNWKKICPQPGETLYLQF